LRLPVANATANSSSCSSLHNEDAVVSWLLVDEKDANPAHWFVPSAPPLQRGNGTTGCRAPPSPLMSRPCPTRARKRWVGLALQLSAADEMQRQPRAPTPLGLPSAGWDCLCFAAALLAPAPQRGLAGCDEIIILPIFVVPHDDWTEG